MPLSDENLEQADVARTAHVRAAAELGGEIADLKNTHAVAVLVAEERERARCDGFVVRNDANMRVAVQADLLVDERLDPRELGRTHGLVVREVEAQPIGRDERALLLDVLAEHSPQRRMQQVRRGVIQHDRCAPLRVDRAPATRSPIAKRAGRRRVPTWPRRAPELLRVRMTANARRLLSRACPCRRPGRRFRRRTACGRALRCRTVPPSAPPPACRPRVEQRDDRCRSAASRSRGTLSRARERRRAVAIHDPQRRANWLALRARSRCASISRSKPSRSIVRPRSRAMSAVRSSGKPYVS